MYNHPNLGIMEKENGICRVIIWSENFIATCMKRKRVELPNIHENWLKCPCERSWLYQVTPKIAQQAWAEPTYKESLEMGEITLKKVMKM